MNWTFTSEKKESTIMIKDLKEANRVLLNTIATMDYKDYRYKDYAEEAAKAIIEAINNVTADDYDEQSGYSGITIYTNLIGLATLTDAMQGTMNYEDRPPEILYRIFDKLAHSIRIKFNSEWE